MKVETMCTFKSLDVHSLNSNSGFCISESDNTIQMHLSTKQKRDSKQYGECNDLN